MCPRFFLQRIPRGFALIAVIFIMVIMSGAVLMMSRFADMQSAERSMDIMGARAQSSARSALQWVIKRVQENSANCATDNNRSFDMHSESDLSSFRVTTFCTPRTYTEEGVTITIFDLTAQAETNGLTADNTGEYVFRRLSAVVEFEN